MKANSINFGEWSFDDVDQRERDIEINKIGSGKTI
jgi:hypothetical protein